MIGVDKCQNLNVFFYDDIDTCSKIDTLCVSLFWMSDYYVKNYNPMSKCRRKTYYK